MNVSTYHCPKCDKLMEPLSYSGITIDRCPNCNGIWLDKGEESFVVEILRQVGKESCENCLHFTGKRKCKLLQIIVSRDFFCSNHIQH